MARKIKPGLFTFRTESTSFQRGKDRPILVTLFPRYVQIRAAGIRGEHTVTWEQVLRTGVEQAVRPRIRRSAI